MINRFKPGSESVKNCKKQIEKKKKNVCFFSPFNVPLDSSVIRINIVTFGLSEKQDFFLFESFIFLFYTNDWRIWPRPSNYTLIAILSASLI